MGTSIAFPPPLDSPHLRIKSLTPPPRPMTIVEYNLTMESNVNFHFENIIYFAIVEMQNKTDLIIPVTISSDSSSLVLYDNNKIEFLGIIDNSNVTNEYLKARYGHKIHRIKQLIAQHTNRGN